MEIKTVKIKDLKPSPSNPRVHPDSAVDKLVRSIKEFGWTNPILVSEDGYILAGHARLKAAEKAGLKEVPAIYLPLSGARAEAYMIADNKLQDLTEWDYPKLKDLLETLDTGDMNMELTGFDLKEIEDLMNQFHVPEEGLTDDDEIPEKVETVCKTGDLWQLGNHRLLCGDATKKEDVDRLMNGEKASCLIADPPWNVGWEYTDYDDNLTVEQYQHFTDQWLTTCSSFLKNAPCFVFQSMRNYPHFHIWFPKAERLLAECQNFTQHTGEWMQWAYNPILVWREGEITIKAYAGLRDYFLAQTSNTQMTEDKKIAKLNTATRWVPTLVYILEGWTKNSGIILDPFGGSGSTLIACEKLGRRCFMMEIDEHYCDVIIQRWQNFTGKKAIKLC